jgi:hypothetical protein
LDTSKTLAMTRRCSVILRPDDSHLLIIEVIESILSRYLKLQI